MIKNLPLISTVEAPRPQIDLDEYQAIACTVDDQGCLTCGDVDVPVTVVRQAGQDAICVDAFGNEGSVATELVGEVTNGERLLVHAGVAIEKLEAE